MLTGAYEEDFEEEEEEEDPLSRSNVSVDEEEDSLKVSMTLGDISLLRQSLERSRDLKDVLRDVRESIAVSRSHDGSIIEDADVTAHHESESEDITEEPAGSEEVEGEEEDISEDIKAPSTEATSTQEESDDGVDNTPIVFEFAKTKPSQAASRHGSAVGSRQHDLSVPRKKDTVASAVAEQVMAWEEVWIL